MKALLVMPRFSMPDLKKGAPRHGYTYDFPLGIAYISAALKKAGHQVRCLNLNHHPEADADLISQAIAEFDPDLCGAGGLTPHLPAIEPIFKTARQAKPGIFNLVGGGLFSSAPEIAGHRLDVDAGVIGEGENAIVEIAAALDAGQPLDGIPGLWLRGPDGQGRRTGERKTFKAIDSLAWPDLDGFGIETLFDVQMTNDNLLFHVEDEPRCVPMISSRSCPFSCTFCFHPNGRVYRERGLDDFFAELDQHIAHHRVNLVTILDELFAVKKQRLVAFCAEMKKRPVRWLAQLHVSVVDDEVLGLMKESGCVAISWGLESMSPEILASMEKKTTPAQNAAALDMAASHGIGTIGNFIFGDPADTEANANHTLEWWARNRHHPISLIGLRVLPGSPVWHRAVAEGRFADEAASIDSPDINVTGIVDDDWSLFFRRFRIYMDTVLTPARLGSMTLDGEHPTRGLLACLEWDCPACGHANRHRRIPLRNHVPLGRIRRACRNCMTIFDLPIQVTNEARDPAQEGLRSQAAALARHGRETHDLGSIWSAIQEYRKLVGDGSPGQVGPSPALREALLDLALLVDDFTEDRGSAAHWIGQALFIHSWEPALHARYARLLLGEGLNGAAAMYLRTAKKLADGDFEVPDRKMGETLDALGAAGPLRFARLRPKESAPAF